MWVLLGQLEDLLSLMKSAPSSLSKRKFHVKKTNLGSKLPYLGIFGIEPEKLLSYLK